MPLFVPKDRRSLFRQLLAGMYDAVVITDPNGYILEINPRTVEHFGRELDELLDKPISVIIPRLKQEVVMRIRKLLASERHVVVDANGVNKDGVKIACEVSVATIDLLNPGDLVFTIRNIERRRAYQNSIRSRANAFALADEALFACGDDGKLTELNMSFIKLFALPDADSARERALAELLPGDDVAQGIKQALAGETVRLSVASCGVDSVAAELVLAPNVIGRKCQGIVGSIRVK